MHHDGVRVLNTIDHVFKTEPDSIRDPEFYLGAKLQDTTLPNGVQCWAMSSSKYFQAAVLNVKKFHGRYKLPTRHWTKQAAGPFPPNYATELDSESDVGRDPLFVLSDADWCSAMVN